MNRLTLSYDDDDPYYMMFIVKLESEHYSGRGQCWVGVSDLIAFGDKLLAYPIDAQAPPTLRYDHESGPALLIEISPSDSIGNLECRLLLSDYYDSRNRLEAIVPTTYQAVAGLEQAVRRLAAPPHADEVVEL